MSRSFNEQVNIWICSPLEEAADDGGVLHPPLGGGGVMIQVSGLYVCARVHQEIHNLRRLGKVQRELTITPSLMNDFRVSPNHLLELRRHAQSGGGVRSERCAAFQQIIRNLRAGAVQSAKAARPPVASAIDIDSRVNQKVDQRLVSPVGGNVNGGRPKASGIAGIDQPPVGFDQLASALTIPRTQSGEEGGASVGVAFHMTLERRPTGKTVFTRDRELGVGQLKRRLSGQVKHSRKGIGVAGFEGLVERFGLTLQVFQVGALR
ncbi:hypothetical protein ABT09_03335 [bacterium SCN 57-13]|nr:MAG: hypothetical protein ABT09_03335 [bacterium SCN 57-13]